MSILRSTSKSTSNKHKCPFEISNWINHTRPKISWSNDYYIHVRVYVHVILTMVHYYYLSIVTIFITPLKIYYYYNTPWSTSTSTLTYHVNLCSFASSTTYNDKNDIINFDALWWITNHCTDRMLVMTIFTTMTKGLFKPWIISRPKAL